MPQSHRCVFTWVTHRERQGGKKQQKRRETQWGRKYSEREKGDMHTPSLFLHSVLSLLLGNTCRHGLNKALHQPLTPSFTPLFYLHPSCLSPLLYPSLTPNSLTSSYSPSPHSLHFSLLSLCILFLPHLSFKSTLSQKQRRYPQHRPWTCRATLTVCDVLPWTQNTFTLTVCSLSFWWWFM